MAVQQDIALLEHGQLVLIEEMAVRGEDHAAARIEKRIVGQHGELEHHLIHVAVAVAAHAHQLVLDGVEHFRHRFGVVFLGQVVARAVIEQIAQQQQFVGLFAGAGVQQCAAVFRRAVQIGSNHDFHVRVVLSFCRLLFYFNALPFVSCRKNAKFQGRSDSASITSPSFSARSVSISPVRKPITSPVSQRAFIHSDGDTPSYMSRVPSAASSVSVCAS